MIGHAMSDVIYPPNRGYTFWEGCVTVFLAGSIEMGAAEEWQTRTIEEIHPFVTHIFNPRRKDWNSSWEQSKDNPHFREQVEWELDHIAQSDIVFMYFDPKTKSPISLLELGWILAQAENEVIVVCPPGFWRKGNVDIICERHHVPVHETLNEGIQALKKYANEL
jgi:hypothetical protein